MEIFKDIIDYEGFYQISNLGNIKSLIINKIISQDVNSCGYKRVTLYKPKRKRFLVHRLVALHFCEGYAEGLVVNHKDGNKINNISTNLEWVSRSENDIHAFKHNLRFSPNTKKIYKYDLEGKLIAEYKSIVEASEIDNVSTTGISYVINGKYKQWKGYVYKSF